MKPGARPRASVTPGARRGEPEAAPPAARAAVCDARAQAARPDGLPIRASLDSERSYAHL
jgi:hypothetical protein